MTLELQQTLGRELDDAIASGDAKRIDRAHTNILLALIDCQRKTAERVKELHRDATARRHKIEGAAVLWKVLQLLAASGGGAVVLKMISQANF